MSYLPRPDVNRTSADVDDIYAIAADELRKAGTAEERREAFKQAMRRAYEAGIDAQREIVTNYVHERPTPLPPRSDDETDPGTLPPNPPVPKLLPFGVKNPRKR